MDSRSIKNILSDFLKGRGKGSHERGKHSWVGRGTSQGRLHTLWRNTKHDARKAWIELRKSSLRKVHLEGESLEGLWAIGSRDWYL